MQNSDVIIGIDLGTTNSVAAACVNGRVEILDAGAGALLPSVVSLGIDGKLVVGHEARNQYILYPERTVKSIKRKMGSAEPVAMADHHYSPAELSAMILREIKRRSEQALGHAVNKAVITVPAYFTDAQRQATKEAGVIAGLEVMRIINEPTAACLSYEAKFHGQPRTVLAYDLGGGTFDVSVVQVDGDMVEVIASKGDNLLGGDDFDEALFGLLEKRLLAASDSAAPLTTVSRNRLRRAAEEAKIKLSEDTLVRVIEDNLTFDGGEPRHLDHTVTRDDLLELIEPLLQKTVTCVHEALAAARKRPADIHEIVLVGGSTRIPRVAELLEAEFKVKARASVHPDLAVAYGAGVLGGRLMGQSEQRVLVDITPYCFGITAVRAGEDGLPELYVSHLIPAGTALPVNRTHEYQTMFPEQDQVRVDVYEGDSEFAEENVLIGEFQVTGLASETDEETRVRLNMRLDLDGILHVTATDARNGKSKQISIDKSAQRLDGEELASARQRIGDLFGIGHQPEEAAPALVPLDPASHEVLRRAEAMGATMDPVDREDAAALCQRLREAHARGDQEAVASARQELEDLLFYVAT